MLINGHYVKGSITFDTSKKGESIRGITRHASWRAVVVYEGKRFRKRSTDRADCERFLTELATEYAEEERQKNSKKSWPTFTWSHKNTTPLS